MPENKKLGEISVIVEKIDDSNLYMLVPGGAADYMGDKIEFFSTLPFSGVVVQVNNKDRYIIHTTDMVKKTLDLLSGGADLGL